MKLYCLVEEKIENGTSIKVVKDGPRELPQHTANVSNLCFLDDKTLKQIGWLPFEQLTENKLVFVSSSYEILEDKVVEVIITRDKVEEELVADTENLNKYKWNLIRQQRDLMLSESDKLVVADKWIMYSPEEKQKIAAYRQSLREIPSEFSDPTEVVFPTL